jgi:hypothetical protein
MRKLSSPSIILEWETVQQGGLSRALAGLREVRNQLAELAPNLDRPAEVIICYDAAVIRERDLKLIVGQATEAGEWPCPVIVCEVPTSANYYQKKNIGAQRSNHDILLFFDTDLLPDAGWLEGMLTPFQRWEVAVVVGGTYLDHAGVYEMAVALFWIFEPAHPVSPLSATHKLVSNNVAVRRRLFLRFPFPDRPTYRGQCAELGSQLSSAGVTIYEQAGARASHPPPLRERFVHRAWCAGQDEHFYQALVGETSLATDWAQVRTDYRNVARRINDRRFYLKPSRAARVLAWFLGFSYYAIKAASYLAAYLQMRFLKGVVPAEG